MNLAEKNCLEPTPIPLPINTDEVEFAPFMDDEYDVTFNTLCSPPHNDAAVVAISLEGTTLWGVTVRSEQ